VKRGNAEQKQQEETIDTQVFKLLEAGRTPVQVATDLDINSGEVTRLYKEWWKLKGLYQLNELYEEIGDDIFQFHRTYKFIKGHGYAPSQLIEAAEHLDELPLLRSERERLHQENQNLVDQRDQLNENKDKAQQELNFVNSDIQMNRKELQELTSRKNQIQVAIAEMITGPGYQKMLRTTERLAIGILRENKVMLLAALKALLQVLRQEPRNELLMLIYGSLNYPLYDPTNGNSPQNYVQMQQALLLESAEKMYVDLLAKVVGNSMSSTLAM